MYCSWFCNSRLSSFWICSYRERNSFLFPTVDEGIDCGNMKQSWNFQLLRTIDQFTSHILLCSPSLRVFVFENHFYWVATFSQLASLLGVVQRFHWEGNPFVFYIDMCMLRTEQLNKLLKRNIWTLDVGGTKENHPDTQINRTDRPIEKTDQSDRKANRKNNWNLKLQKIKRKILLRI